MKSSKKSLYIFSVYFIIYLILGAISLTKKELITVDKFIAAGFCIFFFFIAINFIVRPFIAFMAGLIFMPHILGIMGMYELASLNYHYDWLVHFSSAFVSVIAILGFLLDNTKYTRKFFYSSFIALAATMAFGAVLELSEYWGFIFIGFGEGYLGFGAGDDSNNYGPWENSSLDSTLNLIGSFAGILIYGLSRTAPLKWRACS